MVVRFRCISLYLAKVRHFLHNREATDDENVNDANSDNYQEASHFSSLMSLEATVTTRKAPFRLTPRTPRLQGNYFREDFLPKFA